MLNQIQIIEGDFL